MSAKRQRVVSTATTSNKSVKSWLQDAERREERDYRKQANRNTREPILLPENERKEHRIRTYKRVRKSIDAKPFFENESLLFDDGGNEKDDSEHEKDEKDASAIVAAKRKQWFLDFGQRNFGSTRCEQCNMIYAPGTDDDRLHRQFHAQRVKPTQFARLSEQWTVVERHVDGSRVYAFDWPIGNRVRGAAARSLDVIVENMNAALGAARQEQHVAAAVGEPFGDRQRRRLFVFVDNERRALGCLMAERIDKAYRVASSSESSKTDEDTHESSSSSSLAHVRIDADRSRTCAASIGIERIWVHVDFRRQSIATHLLDAARRGTRHARVVDTPLCAFSQPTADGQRLAERYTGRSDFLIY
jgi:N-acetyltransferase